VPITPFLPPDHQFDPETKRTMGVAFEMTLAALRLSDRSDPVVGIVARRIIELVKSGQPDADLLCEQALVSLGVRKNPGQHSAASIGTPTLSGRS
jgi:hypothetical protein